MLLLLPVVAFCQEKYTITGEVRLADIGETSDQIILTLWPDQKIQKPNTEGQFVFSELYEGSYRLRVQHVGYVSQELEVMLEGNDVNLDIVLEMESYAIEEVAVQGKQVAVDNLVKAENAAMPVTVITRREIELMGSRRLDEIMKEQTGVAVVNDIASGSRAIGVQVQGFSSNYVMVLIDGQPMLGRNNGNFDLSRISVTNVERIEMIKGASSCLYGSDALGGAINIITRNGAITPQAHASLLYGSLNTVDATAEAETPFANQRGSVVVSGNYYKTDGFNTDSKYMIGGTTIPPYRNYSFQGRARYRLSRDGTLGVTARYTEGNSEMMNIWSDEWINKDKQTDRDLNLSASYDHNFTNGVRSMSRYYFTRYENEMQANWINQNALIGAEKFGQQAHRLEQQFAYAPIHSVQLTGGIGGSLELMDNKDLGQERNLNTVFAYLQTEWQALARLRTTTGLRYDHTNVYHGRVSPSLGLQYNLSEAWLMKAGIGAGFKAPDYKMRYQVFYNPAANYMVVGTDQVREVMEALDRNGELSFQNSYMLNLTAGNLKAENSLSTNVGFVWNPHGRLRAEASVFYHRIANQINAVAVGNGTTIGQIFTYRNLPRAANKGFELSMAYHPLENLNLSVGYQYLIAKDLSVLDSIRAGNYPYNQMINNPITGESRPVKENDYWGIEDRSRHMINLKATYEYRPWNTTFNLRANIRGRYPFQEINGNQFIDEYDAFVPDHTLLNLTVKKRVWKNKLTVRLIADNLLGFTHRYMPGQPGRVILGGMSYRWFKE
ncbi:TonB-dependent receptor [Sphingobacterium corticibacterium]|uniref:TonB-dependent receptor n=1 Tax=Sphingobacterium corticibacterium TaxID=2484746 RepID=A0A4Q6XN70_9SPHI|nr:TonB-dependent receptor [Sphingobacterium corticibacterium]RZF61351.1 TonB-dependent receptor [Sphingobacterium corticibacterium]